MSIPAASSVRIPQPANNIVPKSALAPETRYAGGVTDGKSPNGGRPFSFLDLIDIVNPLQHIPVVSTLYRHITGDEISNFSRVAGGILFGGLAGAAIGGTNAIMASETGKDIGQTVLSKFLGDDNDDKASIQTASLKTETPIAEPVQTAAAGGHGPGKSFPIGGKSNKNTVPVIEVRPDHNASKTAPVENKQALPSEQAIEALRDLSPADDKPFTLSHQQLQDPNSKDAIQRAMMDALLKMQELDDQDQSSSDQDKIQ